MPQSLAQIFTHIVFSTKNRYHFLSDLERRSEMHRYLGGTCSRLGSPVLAVGGGADHVHILCSLSRNHSIARVVYEVKRSSSSWIKSKGGIFTKFQWQRGYAVFSVGCRDIGEMRRYIAGQEAHHRRSTFQDEYRLFLARYEIEFDERYVWD